MRDWLRLYRKGGFEALHPKPRADLGQPRRLPAQAAELLISIKTEHPTYSVRKVIEAARGRLGGQAPLDRWALTGDVVRYPEPGLDLDDLFLFEAKRRVMKDRTVSLNGRLYEVDPLLVGESVVLRYDPSAPPDRPIGVRHNSKDAGQATRLDAYANTAVRRLRPSWRVESDGPAPEPPPSPLAMRNLKEKS